jgi:hypothetical protein
MYTVWGTHTLQPSRRRAFGRLRSATTVARLVISDARHPLPRGALMTTPADTFTANRFSLAIDGYEIASFSDLGGVVSEVWSVPDFIDTGLGCQIGEFPES